MSAPYDPARFTEAARMPGVFHDEHMHGAVRHSHSHLHDEDDAKSGMSEMYLTTPLHGHSHCRTCGADDRICNHDPRKKS